MSLNGADQKHRITPATRDRVLEAVFLQSPRAAQEPPKQLKGYSNVTLAPGQTKFVLFRLTPSELAYYDASSGRWTVAPGRYTVLLGTSSTELDRAASFDVGRFGHR